MDPTVLLALAALGCFLLALLVYGAVRWWTIHRSPIERVLAKAIRKAGLPEPVRQHPVRRNGRVVTIPDFAYPPWKIAVFCDGWAFHGTQEAAIRDAQKRNFLSRTGWIVLVFHGRTILRETAACVDEIREALKTREDVAPPG